MRFPKQFLGTVGMCLTLLVALSGCVRLDRNVQLQGDGSGTFTTTLGLSSQLVALDTTGSLKKGFATCGNTITTKGGSYRTYDDGDYSYWAFSASFKTIADLNNLLQGKGGLGNCAINNSSTTITTSPPVSTDTFHVTEQSNIFANTFHVTGHISFKSTTPDSSGLGSGTGAALMASARETFSVTMPNISAHTGGTQTNNTVLYTLHYGDESAIDVTGSGMTTATSYAIIGGGTLALLAIAGLAVWLIRRRQIVAAVAAPTPVVTVPLTPPDASMG